MTAYEDKTRRKKQHFLESISDIIWYLMIYWFMAIETVPNLQLIHSQKKTRRKQQQIDDCSTIVIARLFLHHKILAKIYLFIVAWNDLVMTIRMISVSNIEWRTLWCWSIHSNNLEHTSSDNSAEKFPTFVLWSSRNCSLHLKQPTPIRS